MSGKIDEFLEKQKKRISYNAPTKVCYSLYQNRVYKKKGVFIL